MEAPQSGLLKDKVIVISGGTKGIGRALAIACAAAGADVVIAGRDKIAADRVLEEIHRYESNGMFVYTDLYDIKYCRRLFEDTIARLGRVDGFVNYAGITSAASLLACDEETFDEVLDVNFKGAFFCVKHAVQSMIKNNGGSIILVNSCHAWRGDEDRVAYACSKGALMTLNEHIAYHYAKYGIRCNLLTMGWSLTEGELAVREKMGISTEELIKTASEMIPMGRMQTPEDYIPGMIYLLSDASSMVTGGNLRISGGFFI